MPFNSRENRERLRALCGVEEELERVSGEKKMLQAELGTLRDKNRVMETLRDSQETEIQTLKVTPVRELSGPLEPKIFIYLFLAFFI